MSITEELIEGLEEFAERLRKGERIMVTTVERCGCDGGCHICNGTGFVREAKTWFPKVED